VARALAPNLIVAAALGTRRAPWHGIGVALVNPTDTYDINYSACAQLQLELS
jgi:hypothetical protein